MAEHQLALQQQAQAAYGISLMQQQWRFQQTSQLQMQQIQAGIQAWYPPEKTNFEKAKEAFDGMGTPGPIAK